MKDTQEHLNNFFPQLARSAQAALLLDYDGTLAPFQLKRDEAFPYPGVPELLSQIQQSDRTRLVLISGRALKDLIPLLKMARVPEIWGSHGWERLQLDGSRELFPIQENYLDGLKEAEAAAARLGNAFEHKPASVALHWRGATPEQAHEMQNTIGAKWREIAERHALQLNPFDGGLELRVPGRHKGLVVETILREMEHASPAVAYLGDDLTDEDAFAALEGRGLRLLVRKEPRDTRADCRIEPPEELIAFLQRWRDNVCSTGHTG